MECSPEAARVGADLLQYEDLIGKARGFQSFLANSLISDGKFSLRSPEYLQWIDALKKSGMSAREILRYEDAVVGTFCGHDLVKPRMPKYF